MSQPGRWPRLQRWLENTAIVALLAIVLCDALPFPDEWRAVSVLLANRLGIGQGRWTMFSPPDAENDRIRAELTLRDGRTLDIWLSPDLTRQSLWQRFVGHRRSEYLDNLIVFGRQYPEAWQVRAEALVRQYAGQGGGVKSIRIIRQCSTILPPSGDTWSPASQVQEEVVLRRRYP